MELTARLVDARTSNRAALGTTALATFSLLAIVVDDLGFPRRIPLSSDATGFSVVAALMALVVVGPWLRPARRPGLVRVRVEGSAVRIADRVLRAADVRAVSVARAARGASVAIATSATPRLVFLELASLEEAEIVARALGASAEPRELEGDLASRAGVRLQGVVSVLLAVTGLLWMLGAFGALPSVYKLVGVAAVTLAPASLVVLLARLAPAKGRALSALALSGRHEATPFDRHVALHARAADAGPAPLGRESAGPRAVLLRRGEATRAWLRRLDALPVDRSAYRGDAMSREALLETLADDAAAVEARAGAARILARRLGEPPPELVRVVVDPDVRVRVEAAVFEDDPEEAATELDRLGPVFRAR